MSVSPEQEHVVTLEELNDLLNEELKIAKERDVSTIFRPRRLKRSGLSESPCRRHCRCCSGRAPIPVKISRPADRLTFLV